MSKIHILEASPRGENKDSIRYRLVLHISIPDKKNAAGIRYHLAVKDALERSQKTKTVLASIQPEELQDIAEGRTVEIVEFYATSPSQKKKQLLSNLRELHKSVKSRVVEEILKQYRYYGYEE